MFAIYFFEEPALVYDEVTEEFVLPDDGDGPFHRRGEIVLESTLTTRAPHDRYWFHAPLSFWRERDYEAQWREGVERLLAGAETSALITGMEDPADEQVLHFWSLYRLDESVAAQKCLWVSEFGLGRLKPEEIYEAVGSYHRENEDGEPLSEWRLPLSDFADYLSDRS